MGNGSRCRLGYHLKSTVAQQYQNARINENGNSINGGFPSSGNFSNGGTPNGGSNINSDRSAQDFLSQMIRRELGQVWRSMLNPDPIPPPRVSKEQTGRDYLWALLGI